MTSLTFYGGVNEIGGNKILLEDQDTRIFLDFGMSFSQSGKYFGVHAAKKMQWTTRLLRYRLIACS